MNQIDLILENIRLGHINQLMLEATTPAEINRGLDLINETFEIIEEMVHPNSTFYNKNSNLAKGNINTNRLALAQDIRKLRKARDAHRKLGNHNLANISDNLARMGSANETPYFDSLKSQTDANRNNLPMVVTPTSKVQNNQLSNRPILNIKDLSSFGSVSPRLVDIKHNNSNPHLRISNTTPNEIQNRASLLRPNDYTTKMGTQIYSDWINGYYGHNKHPNTPVNDDVINTTIDRETHYNKEFLRKYR